jgi:hypothetical protein
MIIRFIASTTDIINFLFATSRPSHSECKNWL